MVLQCKFYKYLRDNKFYFFGAFCFFFEAAASFLSRLKKKIKHGQLNLPHDRTCLGSCRPALSFSLCPQGRPAGPGVQPRQEPTGMLCVRKSVSRYLVRSTFCNKDIGWPGTISRARWQRGLSCARTGNVPRLFQSRCR